MGDNKSSIASLFFGEVPKISIDQLVEDGIVVRVTRRGDKVIWAEDYSVFIDDPLFNHQFPQAKELPDGEVHKLEGGELIPAPEETDYMARMIKVLYRQKVESVELYVGNQNSLTLPGRVFIGNANILGWENANRELDVGFIVAVPLNRFTYYQDSLNCHPPMMIAIDPQIALPEDGAVVREAINMEAAEATMEVKKELNSIHFFTQEGPDSNWITFREHFHAYGAMRLFDHEGMIWAFREGEPELTTMDALFSYMQ